MNFQSRPSIATDEGTIGREEGVPIQQQRYEQRQIIDLPGLEGAVIPTISFARVSIIPELTGGLREEIIRILGGYRAALPDPEEIEQALKDQKHLLVGNRAVLIPTRFNGNRYRVSESFAENCAALQMSLKPSPSDIFHTWFKRVHRLAEMVGKKPRFQQVGITPCRPIEPYRETLIFVRTHLDGLLEAIEHPLHFSKKQKRDELAAMKSSRTPYFLYFKQSEQEPPRKKKKKNKCADDQLRERLKACEKENEVLKQMLYKILLTLLT